MQILVIRHGQSQADLEDRHEGRADFPSQTWGWNRPNCWRAGLRGVTHLS